MDRDPINVPPPDLEAEADQLVEKLAQHVEKHKEPVKVSFGRVSGRVRRNSPCPCGSGIKYKKCCMDAVDAGILPELRRHGKKRQPPTKVVEPGKPRRGDRKHRPTRYSWPGKR